MWTTFKEETSPTSFQELMTGGYMVYTTVQYKSCAYSEYVCGEELHCTFITPCCMGTSEVNLTVIYSTSGCAETTKN